MSIIKISISSNHQKGEQLTRIDYNGTPGYISSEYITTQVPETTALQPQACVDSGEITMNPSWKYAEFSKINSGAAVLYRSEAASPKGITVCVNAGHGTKGGASVKTQCHPDGTPKVTGGTTGAGATSAAAGIFISKLIPMIRTIISIPAGVIRMNFVKYTISSALGIFVWNFFLIGAGYVMGDQVFQLLS